MYFKYIFPRRKSNAARAKAIIQATVPALQQYGEAITTAFYKTLFEKKPSLLNIFNPANQRNGGQSRSLAASILTYAAHIDPSGSLLGSKRFDGIDGGRAARWEIACQRRCCNQCKRYEGERQRIERTDPKQ
jgi:hypothetical protein